MLGFKHAFRGLSLMIRRERNFKIHIIAFLSAILLGVLLKISIKDWTLIFIASALVFSLETINSAIEKVCDLITKESNPYIKNIKDISAAAVLIASAFALLMGVFIFYPYISNLL